MDAVAYVVSPSLFATIGGRPPLTSEWYAWNYLQHSVFAASADANVGLLSPESPSWYAWYIAERVLAASGSALTQEVSDQLESAIASISAAGTALTNEINATSSASAASIEGSGGALTDEISSQLTSETTQISANGGALTDEISVQITSLLADISATGGANIAISGQQLAINVANIGANGQLSAVASVNSAESTANAAIITARAEEKEVFEGGGYETYQEYFLDVRAKVVGINAIAKAGKVNAFGLIVNNAVARPISAVSDSNLSNISANGILDIDESELLLLLIA